MSNVFLTDLQQQPRCRRTDCAEHTPSLCTTHKQCARVRTNYDFGSLHLVMLKNYGGKVQENTRATFTRKGS